MNEKDVYNREYRFNYSYGFDRVMCKYLVPIHN